MSSDFSPDPEASRGPRPPQEPTPPQPQQWQQHQQYQQPPNPPQAPHYQPAPQYPQQWQPEAQQSSQYGYATQNPYQQQYAQHEGAQSWQPGYGRQVPPSDPRFGSSGRSSYVFQMPNSWPRGFSDMLPSGGIKHIFETRHMPIDARIGYWVNLVVCVLAIISAVIGIVLLTAAVLFSVGAMGMILFFLGPWAIFFMFAYLIFALVMSVVQLTVTLKIREGSQWARLVLSALAVAAVLIGIIYSAAASDMVETGGLSWTDIVTLAMAAVFWLPQANAWFLSSPQQEQGRRTSRH